MIILCQFYKCYLLRYQGAAVVPSAQYLTPGSPKH